MTGCGSSSSNNPVGNGIVSSGLVSVNGNVKNSNGNGTVSFYTPTAIYGTNLDANNLRTSVANNEVYTFNIDENGNYSGQIPAGEYYVIAQNSDGSMKYASARQSFVSSARAEVNKEKTVDIELVPTITISGTITPSDMLGYVTYVYLENMPFASNNIGSDGTFEFNSVPASSSYTICSNIWIKDNTRWHFSTTLKADSTTKILSVNLADFEPISLSGKKVKLIGIDPLEVNNIIAITDNEICSAQQVSNKEGSSYYVLPIDNNHDVKILIKKPANTAEDTMIINVNSEMLVGEDTINIVN